jgi:hypothetical protein
MIDDSFHLGPEELDLWLDGRLPAASTSHLETCEHCRTAAEETREIVQQLSRLPKASPGLTFADRVMARVNTGAVAIHLTADDLDAWVAGALPAQRETHLRACPACQTLANQERVLVMRLQALPLFDPRPGFADRVMDRVNVPVTSIGDAWRLWRGRVFANPIGVGIAASVAVLLGGSVAASAAWAAANQDTITGAGSWMMSHGQEWFWQGIGMANAMLDQQSWYPTVRASLTPGRIALLGTATAGLYAAGLVALRRLLSLPRSQVARALP